MTDTPFHGSTIGGATFENRGFDHTSNNLRIQGLSGNALFSGSIQGGGATAEGKGLAAMLALLGIVGGPLGIAAALVGFGIGAIGGLRAKKEEEKLARERMTRITKMMIQEDTDSKIEQDEIGRGISKAVGRARTFSETQENMSLDLRMAEDIIAEGARQNYAVSVTNERRLEAMQLAKDDISQDLRSSPKPIVSAVQSALDLGAAANVLSGSIINAIGAANQRNRQQDKDNATNAINQSVAEGGRTRLETSDVIHQIMQMRTRFAMDQLWRAGGGGSTFGPHSLNIFGDPGN